jgi:murein DD-endopeptidase MepM/ murein hydrolase activator NlpD
LTSGATSTTPSVSNAPTPASPTERHQPTTASGAPTSSAKPTHPGSPADVRAGSGTSGRGSVDAASRARQHPAPQGSIHSTTSRHSRPAHSGAPRPSTPAGPGPTAPSLLSFGAPAALDPITAEQIAHFESIGASLDQPPAFLIPIYKAAGRRYHVPWQLLAAINAIETDYGRNLSVSVAGAVGWMQFEPGTWLEYGVSVDSSRQPNPYDPRDAIFSAARYLAANGAPEHMRQAIFAYNHALWYVDAVLWRAQLIGDRGLSSLGHASGYAFPLDARYMQTLGRTDDGVDIETAPDGAAVYSITPGIVTAVASDPSGFGPNYPAILVTAGPLAGQYIYYGHVAASLVKVGDHVLAGQPIAVMGHTGDAASLGHGHIEIGFSDGSGDPLNHHGSVAAGAWTPAGDAMRHVLEALAATLKIKSR